MHIQFDRSNLSEISFRSRTRMPNAGGTRDEGRTKGTFFCSHNNPPFPGFEKFDRYKILKINLDAYFLLLTLPRRTQLYFTMPYRLTTDRDNTREKKKEHNTLMFFHDRNHRSKRYVAFRVLTSAADNLKHTLLDIVRRNVFGACHYESSSSDPFR